jgi:hypothetical protein
MRANTKGLVSLLSFIAIGLLVIEIPATAVASTSTPILTSANNLFDVVNRNGKIASIVSDVNDTTDIELENITGTSATLFSGNTKTHYLEFIQGSAAGVSFLVYDFWKVYPTGYSEIEGNLIDGINVMLVAFIPFQNDLGTEDLFYMNYSSTLTGQFQGLDNALFKVAAMYQASGNQTLILLASRYKMLTNAVSTLTAEMERVKLAGTSVKYTQTIVFDSLLACIGSALAFAAATVAFVGVCLSTAGLACFWAGIGWFATYLDMAHNCEPANPTPPAIDTIEVETETPSGHRIGLVNVTVTNSTWSTSGLSNKHGVATFQVAPGFYTVTADDFTATTIYFVAAPIPATATVILKRFS